LLVYIIN